MSDHFKPKSSKEIESIVRWAVAEEYSLEIVGSGSKRELGRPTQVSNEISLEQNTGILFYEPKELVLSVRSGTPVSEIESLLKAENQELAFEPIDLSSLLGTQNGKGTIGGLLSSNFSGPRRLKVGAVRDHVLGIEAISGRGEIYKSGGRVVKNVTGYDLSRGICGSWGTLSVLANITLKVSPSAETQRTFCILGLTVEDALGAMTTAMGSPTEISGASYIPASFVTRLQVEGINFSDRSVTLLRLEGFAKSVEYRFEKLKSLFTEYKDVEQLNSENSKSIWEQIKDVNLLENRENSMVWKISVAPTSAVPIITALQNSFSFDYYMDWSGGLIWLEISDGKPHDAEIRAEVDKFGGHAMLMRATAPVRGSIPVFHPQSPELAGLTKRLKEQFDPKRVLNPSRMYVGV